jgi:hypothetical protein
MTDEESVEETVMLTRRDRRRAAANAASAPEGTDVQGTGLASDEDEATVVVDRSPGRSRRRAEGAEAADPSAPASSDPDPSEPEARDVAAEAFAAPAVPEPAIYKPRPAPLGPSAPPVVIGGVPPTRVQDAERPSVAKHSRRWSTLTLAAFAVACAVSAAGLVGVGLLVFG